MDILTIILEQIGLFVIYIIVGVLLVRAKVFNATTLETLSRFVLKLGLPVMIFINTVSGVDRAALIRSLPVLGLAVAFYFVPSSWARVWLACFICKAAGLRYTGR